jgi:Ca-activated chloride channel homolog
MRHIFLIAVLVVFFGIELQGQEQLSMHELRSAGDKRWKKRNYQEAEIDYRRALVLDNTDNAIQYNVGCALFMQGKLDEALPFFLDATQSSEVHLKTKALYNVGCVYLTQNKNDQAIDALRRTLKLQPGHRDAQKNLSIALQKKKQEPEQPKPEPQQGDEPLPQDPDQQQPEQGQNGNKKMTPEQARAALEMMNQHDRDVRKRLKKAKAPDAQINDKDW